MLTGEPRRATVIARTNVECYRLDKAGFETVLRTRPDIAGELSRVLVARENDLAWRKDAAAAADRAPAATTTSSRAFAASSASATRRRRTGRREEGGHAGAIDPARPRQCA